MHRLATSRLDRSGVTDKKPQDFKYPDHEVLSCPYPFYTALRTEAPVYQIPGSNMYLISRYEDVQWAARDTEYLSVARPYQQETDPVMHQLIAEQRYPTVPAVTDADPPLHKRNRALMFRIVTPAKLRAYQEPVTGIVTELIDGFIDRGSAEFVSEFAIQLPVRVICYLLGLEREKTPQVKEWTEAWIESVAQFENLEMRRKYRRMVTDFYNFAADEVDARIREPRDDAISELLNTTMEDGTKPDAPLVMNMVRNLLVAGHETTAGLLGAGMYLMVTHRGMQETLAANFKEIPKFLEECVRIEGPVQWSPRVCAKEFTLDGVTIPSGARVLVLNGAADRDGSKFESPDRFDHHRTNLKDHVGFGSGIHSCLGAPLARLEGRIAFEQLLTRLKNICLDPSGEPVPHGAAMALRFWSVPILFDRA